MTTRSLRLATALAVVAAVAACADATSLPRIAAAQAPGARPSLGLVHTLDCGGDDGGFGAPVRHFGNPTPFSENPFNACWPR